ncbi:DUF72 domain-containing protein [Paracoccus sp. Z118]|uniref:DUF72 domain-containing protein n=1 Tax=Paracoccus sp. Z118 TaxID=2851017 RepID=UPI001C2C9302|nr:DUF72 domain-containing protein [Paracoccus sp. Z118]
MPQVPRIRVGVGGWTYEPWDESFYPAGLRKKDQLSYAANQLDAIEINGTFYRTQKPETFQNWHDAAPEGFVFAVKAPRYAVQKRVLAEAGESISRFAESGLERLGDRLGPILWQLAPTKKYDPEDFAAFLDLLPARAGDLPLRHAVELRHPSFACAEAVDACRARNVAIVLAGDSEHPLIADQTADFSYLRIMGTAEGPEAGYAPADLDRWAGRARVLAGGRQPGDLPAITRPLGDGRARDVFLFVISGYKVMNPAAAKALMARLES